jgi:hypothetical protein
MWRNYNIAKYGCRLQVILQSESTGLFCYIYHNKGQPEKVAPYILGE